VLAREVRHEGVRRHVHVWRSYVRKLISAIAVMDGIDPELSAPLRERLASIK
jgi:hypothetical protein